jgi:phage repressor protein C with HTH and peptisase S24 domain
MFEFREIDDADRAKVVIKSVNPDYETCEREAEELNIIGRVVWAAKRL